MKIHKKILLHYQSCDSPVDKEGYLYKKVNHTSNLIDHYLLTSIPNLCSYALPCPVH